MRTHAFLAHIRNIYVFDNRSFLGSSSECAMDLVFIVDTSTSVFYFGPENRFRMEQFLINIVEHLDVTKVRVACVTFSNEARVEFHLDWYARRDQFIDALASMSWEYGDTNTAAALRIARQEVLLHSNGNRPDAQDIILLLTDGNPTVESTSLKTEVELLKADNVRIIVVGVEGGDGLHYETFEMMTSDPTEDNLFLVDNFLALQSTLDVVLERTCKIVDNFTGTLPPNCKCVSYLSLYTHQKGPFTRHLCI